MGNLQRCLRVSDSVTYQSTLPSSSPLAALHFAHSDTPNRVCCLGRFKIRKMYKEFAAYIEKERLFAGCKRLLLAVSGGVDSVVLTHLMERYRVSRPETEVAWVHCNFHLRGEESERDERFVREWAEVSGCRLYVRAFDTERYAKAHKISIEMAARDLRYAYFAELMEADGWDACLLAHHADDNAETFFINLFRGSGVKGLRGMLPRSMSKGHVYLRPLLFARRAEIMAYAQEQSLAFVEDSTNREQVYLRNRIRLSLLPFIDSVQPGSVRKITQSMETLRAVDALVDDWFAVQKQKVVVPVTSFLPMKALVKMGLNPVLQELHVGKQELLPLGHLATLGPHKALFGELYLREKSFNRSQIAQILQNEQNGISGRIFENSDNSGVLVREPHAWRWVALEEASAEDLPQVTRECRCPFVSTPDEWLKGEPGPECVWEIKCIGSKNELNEDPKTACLAYAKLQFPLHWRHWQPGDRFKPLGMKGFKKLSDFFSDLKLSRVQKESVWLLCSGEDIVWVAGYRIDDRYKVDFNSEEEKKVLLFRLR